jgi:hypothetical protein
MLFEPIRHIGCETELQPVDVGLGDEVKDVEQTLVVWPLICFCLLEHYSTMPREKAITHLLTLPTRCAFRTSSLDS